jgi:hypothetical protein
MTYTKKGRTTVKTETVKQHLKNKPIELLPPLQAAR